MCVFGMALNDSGIAIPAIMFTLLVPYVVCLAVVSNGAIIGTPTEPNEADVEAAGGPNQRDDQAQEVSTR